MIEIKDGNKTIYFVHQKEADNYNDYLKNGLKVVRIDNRTYYFNNGDRLIDVTMNGAFEKKYISHSGDRTIKSEKFQCKHIQTINQWKGFFKRYLVRLEKIRIFDIIKL